MRAGPAEGSEPPEINCWRGRGGCAVVRRCGTQPRWAGVTGLEPGSPKSSVLGSIYSCSDFGTGARNRVSSGRKRRFPPRGTDKGLINGSKSRPMWQSARALRSRIAGGGGEKGRGLSLTASLRPQLPLPRHCGAPRPEMAEGVLPRPIWAPETAAGARPRRPRSSPGVFCL